MSVNHEDLDVDINFVNEGDEETELIFIEEEDSIQCLKILSQHTV